MARSHLPSDFPDCRTCRGVLPPLTPEAQAKRAAAPRGTYGNGPLDGPEDFTFYDRCISLGAVGSLTPKIYGNAHRIVQTPGFVALTDEMIHETRIIPLDGRPHPGAKILTYMGDSRGHWEGDTLVVETTNFNGKLNYSGLGSTLVERLTRRAEPAHLRSDHRRPHDVHATRPFVDPVHFASGLSAAPTSVMKEIAPYGRDSAASAKKIGSLPRMRQRELLRPRRPIQGELGVGGNPIGQTPGAPPLAAVAAHRRRSRERRSNNCCVSLACTR